MCDFCIHLFFQPLELFQKTDYILIITKSVFSDFIKNVLRDSFSVSTCRDSFSVSTCRDSFSVSKCVSILDKIKTNLF